MVRSRQILSLTSKAFRHHQLAVVEEPQTEIPETETDLLAKTETTVADRELQETKSSVTIVEARETRSLSQDFLHLEITDSSLRTRVVSTRIKAVRVYAQI
jgi:hypothetical protein